LEKSFIAIRGRAKTVGKPLQYGSTAEFLKFFGLATLGDLPKMAEIVELIKAKEPQGQTELALPSTDDEEPRPEKLNIADGTYQPTGDDDLDPSPSPAVTTTDDEGDGEPEPEQIERHAVEDQAPAPVSEIPDPASEEPQPAVVGEDIGHDGPGVIVDMDTTDKTQS
jgi:hypothetical protein